MSYTTFNADTGNTNTSINVTGLINNRYYQFKVSAINSEGVGLPAETISVAPRIAPNAPTNVVVSAGNAEVIVSWTASNLNGGSAIAGYKVEYAVSPYSTWSIAVASTTSTTHTVTGLTNGNSYKFRVTGTNQFVTGPTSELSSAVTPTTFSATGGTITTYTLSSVNYKVHTFLYDENNDTDGQTTYTFTVTGSKAVDFLIVAGGGSGGGDNGGGGGAGGGLYYGQETPNNGAQRQITSGNYTVKVGKGGLARQGNYGQVNASVANDGYNSSITIGTTYEATGGGAGGVGDSNKMAGRLGGSGGGGGGEGSGGTGGAGVSEQGNAGGSGGFGAGGGGGGGAGGAGENYRNDGTKLGGDGGIGVEYNIRTGTNQWYAAGGTAGGENNRHSTRSPISGIGGVPPYNASSSGVATSGQNETGSGGGGYTAFAQPVNGYYGGHGGTGIVVIRYVV